MHRYDLHEQLHLPHWRLTSLHALFATATLRTFAYSLIGVFVPIFIYQLNESIAQVLVFFAILRGVELLANYSAISLLPKLGYAKAMFLANLMLVLHVLLLRMGENNELYIYLSAVVVGLLIPFYWVPYHLIFALDGVKDKLGKEIGSIKILGKLANAVGPLFGGLIITMFGFSAVFAVTAVMLIASVVPIYFLREKFSAEKIPSFSETWKLLWNKRFRDNLIGFVSIGSESSVQSAFWPLFLFIFVGGIEVVGSLTTLVLVLSVVVVWLVGNRVDGGEGKETLGFGALGNGVVWVLKMFAQSVGGAFVVDSAYKVSKSILVIPFDTFTYKKAQHDPLKFMIAREWAINGGRFLTLLALLVLVSLGVNWLVAFVIAAVASLGTVFLARE